MIRLSSLFLCSTLVFAAAAISCGAGSSGGEGGSGSGGVTTGSGGTSGGSGGTSGGSGGTSSGSGGVAGGGGGGASGAQNAVSIVPADKEVSGWPVDLKVSKNKDGKPMTAFLCDQDMKKDYPTDPDLISMLIDGGATPFCVDPYRPTLFAWQNYANETLPSAPDGAQLWVYVSQYPSADDAAGLYKAVMTLSDYVRKQGTPDDWQPSTMGTESRIQDTGGQWWINFHQGPFYVEVWLAPSSGPAPDYTPGDAKLKEEAVRFAKAVAAKIKS